MSQPTLEELFDELKKLPDWNRYPYPEVFYQHFGVSKPKPATLMEGLTYQAPPSQPIDGDPVIVPKDSKLRAVGYQGLPVSIEFEKQQPDIKKLNWETLLKQNTYEAKRDAIIQEIHKMKEQYKAGDFKKIEMVHNWNLFL